MIKLAWQCTEGEDTRMRRVALTLILPSMIGPMCPSYQGQQYNTMETTLFWSYVRNCKFFGPYSYS